MLKTSAHEVVAANVRRLRYVRNLSLPELSSASGVSIGSISSLESGEANPTLETLTALAEALEVSVEDLFRRQDPGIQIVRSNETERSHRLGLTAYTWGHLAAGNVDLELALMRIGRAELAITPGVVEHVIVVAGNVDVDFGDEKVSLRQFDYMRFEADAPHVYEAVGVLARAIRIRERRG